MTIAPKILTMQELVEPPEELVEGLNADFLRPLRISNPPPVRIASRRDGARWGGYCPSSEYAEHGEVVLSDYRHPPEKWLVEEWFRGTYLHEIAHRFLSGYQEKEIGGSHGPVFFAMQFLLFLRAGERESARPWFLRAGVYDLQDAWLANGYTPGQALDWACRQGEELSDTEISAEQAAVEIVGRFESWLQTMAQAPAKRQAAHAARAEREAALIRKTKNAKWWICYSIVLGVMAGLLAGLLVA